MATLRTRSPYTVSAEQHISSYIDVDKDETCLGSFDSLPSLDSSAHHRLNSKASDLYCLPWSA
eukprot:scaffold369375_cov19-Prasinocladus_malaysianus.AAC.1